MMTMMTTMRMMLILPLSKTRTSPPDHLSEASKTVRSVTNSSLWYVIFSGVPRRRIDVVPQTKYTMATVPPPGFLCHKCAKSSGADPFKKPAAPRKREAPADKRKVIHFEELRIPSLATLCINASVSCLSWKCHPHIQIGHHQVY